MSNENTNALKEAEVFALIREVIAGTPNEAAIEEYLVKKEEQAEARKAKEAERRAKKRAEGDDRQNTIKDILAANGDFMTVVDLTVAYNEQTGSDLVSQAIVTKVKNLIEAGVVEKADVKVGNATRKAYKFIG